MADEPARASRFGACGHALRRSAADIVERRRIRALVTAEARYLRPGPYVRAGSRLWHRPWAHLPEHLVRTKGFPRRSWRRRLVDGARGMLTPSWFWVRRRPGTTQRYDIAVATSDGGLVLLDALGGRAARIDSSLPVESLALRQRFARHVPSPSFEVHEGGRVVVEELVAGRYVDPDQTPETIAALSALADRWTQLVRAEAEDTWEELLRATVEACRGLDLPPAVLRTLRAGVPVEVLDWPRVPSAADATLRNVVLTPTGPVLIDLGDVRLEPAHSWLLGAVADGGPPLLAYYLDGGFDRQLHELTSQAARSTAPGAAWPPGPWTREDALAVRTCVVTALEADGDQARLVTGVRHRWRRLENDLTTARAALGSRGAT